MRWVLLGCLGFLLAAGCSEDNPANVDQGPPDYLPNTSPENLIANLAMAWEAMDAEGYAALLYGGEQPATDGDYYAPFKFHFEEGGDPGLPAFWVKSREEACAERLLGGLPGDDGIPGIASISMELDPIGAWDAMGGDEIAGDPFPATARWCLHTVSMLMPLEESWGETTSKLAVSGRFLFQCVPVDVEGTTEWRLWKWWDETDRMGRETPGDTEVASLSRIKAFFAPPPPAYLPNDSPDHLMANLVLAWEALDPLGYAALLYDGSEAATDGEHYLPFRFYFDQTDFPYLPVSWPCADELACMETLLGEEPGAGIPGLRAVNLDLLGSGAWQAVVGGQVEGDPCPEAALWRVFSTDLLFMLKAPYGGGIGGFHIQDQLIVHCLPVQAGGGTEWRLWKWRDVHADKAGPSWPALSEEPCLGSIKALYGP